VDVELDLLHEGENIDWGCFQNGFWGYNFDPRKRRL